MRKKKKGKRKKFDRYYTPAWCVHRLLDAGISIKGRVLEPCAGIGSIIAACKSHEATRFADIDWTTVDIVPHASVDHIGDFLSYRSADSFDAVITNPPYTSALGFAMHAMTQCRGLVIMLLRLNWLATQKRQSFISDMPPDVYVLPNRPSFVGGGTDMTEYAWMVWDVRSLHRKHGRWQVLECTSLEDRVRYR